MIDCPLNGLRNVQEFVYGGEVVSELNNHADPTDWADYVFLEDNTSGVADEWWCHAASNYWFIVRRQRTTNTVVATFRVDEYFNE